METRSLGKLPGSPFVFAVSSHAFGVCRQVTASLSMISIQRNFHAACS
jgi:hypothetical protein